MPTKYQHLSQEQRYQIEALIAAGNGPSAIAIILGKHKSTISREIRRNSTAAARPPDRYKAAQAHRFATLRAYSTPSLKSTSPCIARRITFLLKTGWSPQQIASVCCQRQIPMLSTEGIYQWVYQQKSKGLADLTNLLRRHHRKRRKRALQYLPRTIIKHKVPIAERPAIVAEQARTGDLETDLMKCTNGYLLTITDRKTLFNFIRKLPNKESATVASAIVEALEPLKNQIFTITSDNGTEFTKHQSIAQTLNIDWYFADAYCSQQRGCNENQNGLIRQYFQRKTDLLTLTQQYVQNIERKLNSRPRKKLNYQSPRNQFLINPVALRT